MKILCVAHFYPPSVGGMQISNSLIIDGLHKLGHEIILILFNKTKPTKSNSDIKLVHYNYNMLSVLDNYKCGKKILKNHKKYSPDLTLLLDGAMERSLGFLPLAKKKNEVFVSINSGSVLTRSNTHIRQKINAFFYFRGNKWLDYSFYAQSTYKIMIEKYPNLKKKYGVLGRPIPEEFFNKNYVTSNSLFKYKNYVIEKPYFFSCARAIKEKGIEKIIKSLARLRDERGIETVNFVFAGDGPDLIRWKNIQKKLKLSKVYFIGNIPHSDLKSFFDNCYMSIFPSFYKGETFGRTWVESFSCGKPVISTLIEN